MGAAPSVPETVRNEKIHSQMDAVMVLANQKIGEQFDYYLPYPLTECFADSPDGAAALEINTTIIENRRGETSKYCSFSRQVKGLADIGEKLMTAVFGNGAPDKVGMSGVNIKKPEEIKVFAENDSAGLMSLKPGEEGVIEMGIIREADGGKGKTRMNLVWQIPKEAGEKPKVTAAKLSFRGAGKIVEVQLDPETGRCGTGQWKDITFSTGSSQDSRVEALHSMLESAQKPQVREFFTQLFGEDGAKLILEGQDILVTAKALMERSGSGNWNDFVLPRM